MSTNNMKSWADEQDESSDEDDTPIIPPSGFPGGANAANNAVEPADDDDDEKEDNYQIPPREFILPSQPPYTAFVGNVPYDIRNSNDLGREVELLLYERQCRLAQRLTDARLMMEKGSNMSRGYGYVEFETREEVRYIYILQHVCVYVPFIFDVCSPEFICISFSLYLFFSY